LSAGRLNAEALWELDQGAGKVDHRGHRELSIKVLDLFYHRLPHGQNIFFPGRREMSLSRLVFRDDLARQFRDDLARLDGASAGPIRPLWGHQREFCSRCDAKVQGRWHV
jgi:hypothetical protein